MNTKLMIAIAATLAFSTEARAAPIFLTCTLTDKDGPSRFDVQANEDAGTVTYHIDRTNLTVTKKAAFSPNAVSFNSFTIDRRDLSFSRENDPKYVSMFGWASVDRGKCVLDTTKRAF